MSDLEREGASTDRPEKVEQAGGTPADVSQEGDEVDTPVPATPDVETTTTREKRSTRVTGQAEEPQLKTRSDA